MIRIPVDNERIADFCRKWKITHFSVFGSVLREDFGPESDLDVLVTFADDAHWTLFDWVEIQEELKETFGREVDLLSRRGVESSRNPIRRTTILSSAETIYAA
jgi:predicted nucleotidyltransferase